MQRRTLGHTNLAVSRLALGCVTFGREIDQAASFAVLDRAVEHGMNLLDTAAAYGGGRSEEVVGQWLASRAGVRDRIVLQTKVTPPLSRERLVESIDASLGRLRTDAVDVFMLHAFDGATPLRETLAALREVVRAGKARYVGCSNFTAAQLEAALALAGDDGLPRLDVTQFSYNLAVRDAERSLLPACRRHGVGVQTYSPLGAGFLTGKYASASGPIPRGSRFGIVPGHKDVYFHEDKFAAAARLAKLSKRVGIPPAQLATAWVLRNDAVDTVLVGARTPGHLDAAVEAMRVRFDPDWVDELAGNATRGERHQAWQWLAT